MPTRLRSAAPYREGSLLSSQIEQLSQLVAQAQTILLLQPEKPDGDSIGSTRALEEILGDLGKTTHMYCYDQVPEYLRYLPGWDRISSKFPADFDLAILVDTGSPSMLSRTFEKYAKQLSSRPFVLIDHHGSREPMPFELLEIIDPSAAACGEQIYHLASQLGWTINQEAADVMTHAILSDTQNLTLPNVTAATVQTVANLVKQGVNLNKIHQAYRAKDVMRPEVLDLKGKLLERVEYFLDGQLAVVTVTPMEMAVYAELHDPADLVIYELRNVAGVVASAVIRDYGTKIKVSLRSSRAIAAPVAAKFGGGGHPQAAGFRVDEKPAAEVKKELIAAVDDLMKKDASR